MFGLTPGGYARRTIWICLAAALLWYWPEIWAGHPLSHPYFWADEAFSIWIPAQETLSLTLNSPNATGIPGQTPFWFGGQPLRPILHLGAWNPFDWLAAFLFSEAGTGWLFRQILYTFFLFWGLRRLCPPGPMGWLLWVLFLGWGPLLFLLGWHHTPDLAGVALWCWLLAFFQRPGQNSIRRIHWWGPILLLTAFFYAGPVQLWVGAAVFLPVVFLISRRRWPGKPRPGWFSRGWQSVVGPLVLLVSSLVLALPPLLDLWDYYPHTWRAGQAGSMDYHSLYSLDPGGGGFTRAFLDLGGTHQVGLFSIIILVLLIWNGSRGRLRRSRRLLGWVGIVFVLTLLASLDWRGIWPGLAGWWAGWDPFRYRVRWLYLGAPFLLVLVRQLIPSAWKKIGWGDFLTRLAGRGPGGKAQKFVFGVTGGLLLAGAVGTFVEGFGRRKVLPFPGFGLLSEIPSGQLGRRATAAGKHRDNSNLFPVCGFFYGVDPFFNGPGDISSLFPASWSVFFRCANPFGLDILPPAKPVRTWYRTRAKMGGGGRENGTTPNWQKLAARGLVPVREMTRPENYPRVADWRLSTEGGPAPDWIFYLRPGFTGSTGSNREKYSGSKPGRDFLRGWGARPCLWGTWPIFGPGNGHTEGIGEPAAWLEIWLPEEHQCRAGKRQAE